jgi:hypothetical protein
MVANLDHAEVMALFSETVPFMKSAGKESRYFRSLVNASAAQQAALTPSK